ncbi:hypothetical protein VE00_10780 [Pseudogymnoascus sp. WSF 3629]|nr:hypothetical protein VE00_10780 [Pseudogymnoascus sp. WSF 3629]
MSGSPSPSQCSPSLSPPPGTFCIFGDFPRGSTPVKEEFEDEEEPTLSDTPQSMQQPYPTSKNPFHLLGIKPSVILEGVRSSEPTDESEDPTTAKFVHLLNQAEDHITFTKGAGHAGPFPNYDDMERAALYLADVAKRDDSVEINDLIARTQKETPDVYFDSILPLGHPNVFAQSKLPLYFSPTGHFAHQCPIGHPRNPIHVVDGTVIDFLDGRLIHHTPAR